MSRPSSKELLLNAAEDIVLEHGALALTLDAVAEKAGVSKGGLLYHFPAKEALLQAMLERLIAQYDADFAAALEQAPDGPRRSLRAHLAVKLAEVADRRRRLSTALLAARANNPRLLDHSICNIGEKFRCVSGGPDGQIDLDSAILTLAADGLLFLELFGVHPLSEADRARVVEELKRRAQLPH